MYLQSNLFKSFGISAVTASLESISTPIQIIFFSSSISLCSFPFFFFGRGSLNISQTSWLGCYFPCTHSCAELAERGEKSQVVHEVLLHLLKFSCKGYTGTCIA